MNLEKCAAALDDLLRQYVETDDALSDARDLGAVLAMLADASARLTVHRYGAVMRLRGPGYEMSLGEIGEQLGLGRSTVQGIVERAQAVDQAPITAASDRNSGEM